MQTTFDACSDVVDILKGAQGQYEHRTMDEHDVWVYGEGRELAKVGREQGRVNYETAPALKDN
jgi:hypothetical protein